jgi:hypothetical protein
MRITLNFNYLLQQLKFVFLFVLWTYCALRIFDNTFFTAWISLTEGFYHPHGLTKWWYYIQMMPSWWIIHLVIIAYIPLLLNKGFQALLQKRNIKIANYFFWFLVAPLSIILF